MGAKGLAIADSVNKMWAGYVGRHDSRAGTEKGPKVCRGPPHAVPACVTMPGLHQQQREQQQQQQQQQPLSQQLDRR